MPFLPALAVLALLPGLTLAQGPELTKEAIANVYKTRDKAAMGKLLAILLEPQPYRPRDKTAERILLTLGDKEATSTTSRGKRFLASSRTPASKNGSRSVSPASSRAATASAPIAISPSSSTSHRRAASKRPSSTHCHTSKARMA
jgi:hypothetical protein